MAAFQDCVCRVVGADQQVESNWEDSVPIGRRVCGTMAGSTPSVSEGQVLRHSRVMMDGMYIYVYIFQQTTNDLRYC